MQTLGAGTRYLRLYARHFDRKWYRSQSRATFAGRLAPLFHYMTKGWQIGLQPARHFLPDWYLAQYKDVADAGVEPFLHYLRYGWREGRDPSPGFANAWYIREFPDAAGQIPLTHYNEVGARSGRPCHPLVRPLAGPAKVGVVILSHNAVKVLRATLESLSRARTLTSQTIYLVENGSEPSVKEQIRAVAQGCESKGLKIRFFDIERNLGFSGGNNVGIRAAMQDGATHVCLLNSDVLVTDYWLDRLVETEAPLVGPVSNAVGNEQTVSPDYAMDIGNYKWETANEFARRWDRVFAPRIVTTEFLGFFCVLIKREAIEAIGNLDERFFPGSFEDDDYCVRAKDAGFHLAIARHVYVHHFGSGTFSTLAMPDRVRIGDINRQRFEEKYGRPWTDRTHLPAVSVCQDLARLPTAPKGDTARFVNALVQRETGHVAELTGRLAAAVTHYRHDLALRTQEIRALQSGEAQGSDVFIKETAAAKSVLQPLEGLSADGRTRLRDMVSAASSAYVETADWPHFSVVLDLQPIFVFLARRLRDGPIVLIAANGHDPAMESESDGYLQRVRAVDGALADLQRIYLHVDDSYRGAPCVSALGKDLFALAIADNDLAGNLLLRALAALSPHLYVHSILPFCSRSLRGLFSHIRGAKFVDAHGVVPEEFVMHNNHFSAQVYGEYEREFLTGADFIVCVTERMARHFQDKYDIPRSRFIVCPIFLRHGGGVARRSNVRPRVIYAGGTQIWQQIPKMVDAIIARRADMDFTILTPAPDVVIREFESRGMVRAELSAHVKAVDQRQVLRLCQLSDFGFLLREDSVVNRVACPTKLIEYIDCGVIPVLDSPEIGDFSALGLRHVRYDDFLAGVLPDQAARRQMIEANRALADNLGKASRKGMRQIVDRIRGAKCAQAVRRPGEQHNIALVVPAFDKGGLEQVVLNLYAEYKRRGFSCVVLAEKNEAGYLSSRVAEGDFVIFNGDEAIFMRECVRRRITLLHYHFSNFALAAASQLGIFTIYTIHNTYTWLDNEAFARHAEAVSYANRIVAVSGAVKEYFCARADLPEHRVDVIPNGIDVDGLLESGRADRRQLGIPEQGFVFAQIASFHRVKHHALALRAAEELAARGAAFHLLFVGNIGDRQYYDEIKSLVSKSPISDRVTILDYVPREKVGALYRNVDCVVLPTLQEGCSNVVLEALAFDRPLIATDVGNIQDVKRLFRSLAIIPRTESLFDLDPAAIDRLSRTGETRNLNALVEAMADMLGWSGSRKAKSGALGKPTKRDAVVAAADRPALNARDIVERELSMKTMAEKYASFFPSPAEDEESAAEPLSGADGPAELAVEKVS